MPDGVGVGMPDGVGVGMPDGVGVGMPDGVAPVGTGTGELTAGRVTGRVAGAGRLAG
jgi:hypothetical protein